MKKRILFVRSAAYLMTLCVIVSQSQAAPFSPLKSPFFSQTAFTSQALFLSVLNINRPFHKQPAEKEHSLAREQLALSTGRDTVSRVKGVQGDRKLIKSIVAVGPIITVGYLLGGWTGAALGVMSAGPIFATLLIPEQTPIIRVLIADDEPAFMMILLNIIVEFQRRFNVAQIRYDEAYSPEQAERLIDTRAQEGIPYHFVLSDYSFRPGGSEGLRIARKVNTPYQSVQTPVLYHYRA
jgi:hypothetical protein